MSRLERYLKLSKKHRLALVLLLPSLAFVVAFTYYPILFGMWMTFFDFFHRPITDPVYVGLSNYQQVFTDDVFWLSLRNSTIWVAASVTVTFLVGFGVALLLNEKIGPLRTLFRGLMLIPWATPVLVSGLVWRLIYSRDWGILNETLLNIGAISTPIAFLSDRTVVWPAILLFFVWSRFPFVSLSILAALQSIPASLREAALVDGANTFQRFRHVIIPGVEPTIVTILLLTTIWGFNDFGAIYTMTSGGPAHFTEILPTLAYGYTKGYGLGNYGRASVVSLVLFLLTFSVGIFYIKRVVRD